MTHPDPNVLEVRTSILRDRLTADRRDMDNRRREYIRSYRIWLEADRRRIDELAQAMIDIGLYAHTTGLKQARFGIGSCMCRDDEPVPGTWRWHRWLDKTGWFPYLRAGRHAANLKMAEA